MNPQDPQNQNPPPPAPDQNAPVSPPSPDQPQVFGPVSPPPPPPTDPAGSGPEVPQAPTPPQAQSFAPQQPIAPSPNPSTAGSPPPAPNPLGVPVPAATPGFSGTKLPKDKPKFIALIVIALVVIILIVAAALVVPKLKGISLESYSNSDFSILTPKDYERKEESGLIKFEEKGSDDKTKSGVLVFFEKSPQSLSKEEQEQALSLVEGSFKEELEKELGNDSKFENYTLEKTDYKGNPARTITADVAIDGKKAGKIKMVVGVSASSVYVVGVVAHQSDKGVEKSIDKIIDSFEIK